MKHTIGFLLFSALMVTSTGVAGGDGGAKGKDQEEIKTIRIHFLGGGTGNGSGSRRFTTVTLHRVCVKGKKDIFILVHWMAGLYEK